MVCVQFTFYMNTCVTHDLSTFLVNYLPNTSSAAIACVSVEPKKQKVRCAYDFRVYVSGDLVKKFDIEKNVRNFGVLEEQILDLPANTP